MQERRELTLKMVAGFRRSLSLPVVGPNSCASPCRRPYTNKPFHARSTSLPCRSHPTLAHLEDEIQSLRSLPARPAESDDCSAATWFADALDRIDRAHAALGELLHLPQETPLRGHPTAAAWADRLLDDALRLADAYASLRSVAVALKQHIAEARAAIRRSDSPRLSSAVRSHRRAEKELARLAAAVKNLITKSSSRFNLELMADAAEVEVAGIIREVIVATAAASAAIFTQIAAVSSSASRAVASTSRDSMAFLSLKRLTSRSSFKKRRELEEEEAEVVAFEKMEGLEECIERLEQGSERVFRSLVNTRVALLNNLTPSL